MVLAGGVALASAGLAIGSQSGDGSASAARDGGCAADARDAHFVEWHGPGGPGPRLGPGPGPGPLAGELGVSEERLRDALDELRPSGDPDKHMDELAAALARRLGVSRERLGAALREVGPPRHRHHVPRPSGPGVDLAEELADALGVEAERVEQALEGFHDAKRREFAQRLADELGIDAGRVEDALPDRP